MRRRGVRSGLVLVLLAVAGFVLAGYGAGVGRAQDTTTALTATTPETTVDTLTETPTTEATTTAPPPTTTAPPATTATPTTTPSTTVSGTTALTETSSSSTPWGWIALGLAIAAAIIIGLLLWRRSRAGAAAWEGKATNLNRRTLVALDDVLARGSVVTGQIEALAADARSLEQSAPDDQARASATDVRGRLDELVRALEADRTLRLGSPPPSGEQVSYSTALIRQQVEQLQVALRRSSAGPAAG